MWKSAEITLVMRWSLSPSYKRRVRSLTVCKPGRGLSLDMELAGILILDFPASRTEWDKCLFCKASLRYFDGLPSGKEPTCQFRKCKSHGLDPWVGKIPWRRKWHPTQVLLPGESHGQRSLVGYGPWGRKELDTVECVCIPKIFLTTFPTHSFASAITFSTWKVFFSSSIIHKH